MWLLTEGLKHKVEDASINSRLLGCKGWVHMCRKQYAQAIVECSKALSLDSEMWEPHLVKYESWKDLGVYSMAVQVCLLHLHSRVDPVWIIMFGLCHGLGFPLCSCQCV